MVVQRGNSMASVMAVAGKNVKKRLCVIGKATVVGGLLRPGNLNGSCVRDPVAGLFIV